MNHKLQPFFIRTIFIRTRLKFGQKLRMYEQSRLGFGIINAKFTFLNKIILFSSNSTVSNVETLQILRSIALSQVRYIWNRYFRSYFLLLSSLTSTFKNKNSSRTIEAEIS